MTAHCTTHTSIADLRGVHADVLAVPRCDYINATYSGWSVSEGGFVFVADCALEVANIVAEQLDEEPDDEWRILRICPDHEDQPAEACAPCEAYIAECEAEIAAEGEG